MLEWIKDALGINRYCIVSVNRYSGEVLRLGNQHRHMAIQVKKAMDKDNYQWLRSVERVR